MKSINTYPRVLIVSHNPFSHTHNNGKTFSAFFKGWSKENIAQLYLTTDVPDFTICEKFFQLNDVDILKRAFLNRQVQGRRVTYSDLSKMNSFKSKIRASLALKILRNNVSPLFQLAKDILWNIGGYKTKELKKFIDEFNPQVVFFHSYKDVYAFSLAKWIYKTNYIPLIILTTDDYVSGKFTLDPFFWIQLIRVRRAFKTAILASDCVVAIGEKMAAEYKSRFGGNYIVAMNAIDNLELPARRPLNGTVKFLYAGNLGLNRWKVLALIAECMKELHHEEGMNGELSIYSLIEPRAKELLLLNVPPFSSYKGALTTDELNNAKANSDVLVHVESFDKKNRHITRLSISTKISEYLASRRCIFAVGPEDVASMQYLVNYDLGVTVMSDNKTNIKAALKKLINDSKLRTSYADKGVEVARIRHDAGKTAMSIFQIISTAVNR